MAREIALVNGRGKTLVDDEDFERLNRYRWHLHNRRYAAMWSGNTHVLMHHVIMGTLAPGTQSDHANGDGLDNRRANLRCASPTQNTRNRGAWGRGSRYKGVTHDDSHPAKPWRARIRFDGKQRHIGRFEHEIEAARAYDRRAAHVFGDFARLNFAESAAA